MASGWWTSLVPDAAPLRARGRAHTTRGLLTGALVGVAVALSVMNAVHTTPVNAVTETEHGLQVAPVGDALRAGCGPLVVVTKPSSRIGWVDTKSVLPYDTAVPTAGWFYKDLPNADDASPAPESVLREMWTGRKVVWLAPDATASTRDAVAALVQAHPEWGLRVATWPAKREQLGGQVAFAAWGATVSCQRVSATVAEQVWAASTGAPGRPGAEAPEARP